MTEDMTISVIMPVHNAERFVGEAIASIRNQTYSSWELLICDDASGDGSLAIAKSFAQRDPRIRVFHNPVNLKVLKTRNRLLEEAKGDLITFLDADDYSEKVRFEKMVREFQSNPRLGLLSSQVGYVDVHGTLLRTSNKPTDPELTRTSILSNNVVGGAVAMIRREALESVGGKFRTFLDGLSYQDYDLSLLIAEKYECYALPDVLYYYRQHHTSNSKIIDPDRVIARELVIELARQRRSRGTDDVMDGNHDRIAKFMDALRQPYKQDPSLIYREYAANFMFNRLYAKACETAWRGIRRRPLVLVNWRTLQYCVRKAIAAKLF